MKTSRIFLIGLLFIGMNMQAQNIYVRAGLGAAVSTSADILLEYNSSSTSNTLTSKKTGLGTGLPFVLAPGYKFNEHFGVELGINYFYGFTIKGQSESSYSSFEKKFHGQMLSLVPAFILTFSVDKIHPYARLGFILGVMNSVVYKNHETYNPEFKAATNEIDSKSKDYGGIAFGAQAALGTDFAISDKISLFGEIQVDGISYTPKHGKYLEYSQNGVDVLNDRTEKQNKWDYKKEVDMTKEIPDDQPDQYPRVNHRFGNVGLVVGVKFNFK